MLQSITHYAPLITHPAHSLHTIITSFHPVTAGTMRLSHRNMNFTSTSKRSEIKCMANQRRVKMVAKQIRRELSSMLLSDNVLQFAVLPEAALGADRYLSCLTTISDVEVSADLQVFSSNLILFLLSKLKLHFLCYVGTDR